MAGDVRFYTEVTVLHGDAMNVGRDGSILVLPRCPAPRENAFDGGSLLCS